MPLVKHTLAESSSPRLRSSSPYCSHVRSSFGFEAAALLYSAAASCTEEHVFSAYRQTPLAAQTSPVGMRSKYHPCQINFRQDSSVASHFGQAASTLLGV